MQQIEPPIYFSGYIYDEGNVVLNDAYVYIWGNALLSDNTTLYLNFNIYADESGYYEVDMPNGSFTADARKTGYIDADNISLELEDNTVSHDFILREVTSSISGYVYDAETGEPLYLDDAHVNVHVYEMDEYGNYNNSIASDYVYEWDNGSYNVTLPDGCFQVRFYKWQNNEISYMGLTHDFDPRRIVSHFTVPENNTFLKI